LSDKKIKAILFDLGDTLVRFGRINTARLFLQSAKRTYNFLKNDGQAPGNFRYYCWRSLIYLRLRWLLSNITGKDFEALALLKRINKKYNVTLSEEQWQELVWLWYEPLSEASDVESGLSEALSSLKDSGLKLGIVSNTFVNGSCLDRHLRNIGIFDFFPVRIYSYRFNFRKPDLRIFKIASQKIGEKASNILFVGDRIDKDIKAALKAGMRAIVKTAHTNINKKLPKGTWKIETIAELPALVKKINSEAS